MRKNQNMLAILRTFLNLQQKSWNSTRSELPLLLLQNLSAKFLTERKYLMSFFRKRVGTQNEKHQNRDMQNYLKISKYLVTLHKTKVITLWVMLAFPTHRHPSKEIFVTKNVLFLLICLHLHLIDHIGKQTFVEKNFFSFIHLTLNIFLIFDFITCS